MLKNFLTLCLLALPCGVTRAQLAPLTHITHVRAAIHYELNADGTYASTNEFIDLLNTPEGVRAGGQVQLGYSSGLQELEVLEAYTIKPDGRLLPVPPSSILSQSAPAAQGVAAFNDYLFKTIIFPDLSPGSSVGYKFRRVQKRPVFDGHFSETLFFPSTDIWQDARVEVSAPFNYSLYTEAVGMEGGRQPDAAGRARWSWGARVVRPSAPEPASISALDYSPRVVVSSFPSYEAVAATYRAAASEKVRVTPEIKALADEVTAGRGAPREQAEALYDWVSKNIRYVGIWLGRGGYVPHDAADILKNRFGDCKDHHVILESLLAAKGIRSAPALVRLNSSFRVPQVASPGTFDHLITYLPDLNVYLDSTAQFAPFGILPYEELGKAALLAGREARLVSLPKGDSQNNAITNRAEMTVLADGSIEGKSVTGFKGASGVSMWALLSGVLTADSAQLVANALTQTGQTGSGNVNLGEPRRLEPAYQVDAQFKLVNALNLPSPGAFAIPYGFNLNPIAALAPFISGETRNTPVFIGAAAFNEQTSLTLPAGVQIDDAPKNISLENAAGSYHSSYEVRGTMLLANRVLVVAQDVYSQEEYPAFRQLLLTALRDAKSQVVYR